MCSVMSERERARERLTVLVVCVSTDDGGLYGHIPTKLALLASLVSVDLSECAAAALWSSLLFLTFSLLIVAVVVVVLIHQLSQATTIWRGLFPQRWDLSQRRAS